MTHLHRGNRISHIPVSAIDRADTGFRITGYQQDIQGLAQSISLTGLLVPPLALAKGKGYTMISGFRRLEAVVALGWDTIPCRVMDVESEEAEEVENAMATAAAAAVAENAFQRDLGPGELIRAAGLLGRHMDPGAMAEKSSALFNTPLNAGYIKSLLNIRMLPDPALDLMDQGRISIKTAKALARMTREDAVAFIGLFSKIKVSSGKQMEILTWAREVAALEKKTTSSIIGEMNMPEPEGHKDMAALGNRIRTALYRRRFPALEAAQKEAETHLKSLKLNPGIRLTLPENFESMVYTLSLDFSSPEEFENRLTDLSGLTDQPGFKTLLKRWEP